MGMNILLAAINKYGFGKYTYGTAKGQVVCNYLVRGALLGAGYTIPEFTTNYDSFDNGVITSHGLFTQADKALSAKAKRYKAKRYRSRIVFGSVN